MARASLQTLHKTKARIALKFSRVKMRAFVFAEGATAHLPSFNAAGSMLNAAGSMQTNAAGLLWPDSLHRQLPVNRLFAPLHQIFIGL